MINLIPNEEKKKMFKDFYLRLIIVFVVMLGISLIFGSIAILPSYFLSVSGEDYIKTSLESQKDDSISEIDQKALDSVKNLKNKLSLIENIQKNKFIFSQRVINEVLLKKPSSIRIIGISYQNSPQSGKKINITGIAPNREILLLFRRVLEDNVAFSKIDLPVSNFVKGSNIKFSLSLIPS